jgi:glycosyltransferase involved in cell wall biosynthesis
LPFINVQLLKQWTVKRSATKVLRRWLKENKDTTDKMVMMYSVYPPYSAPAVKLCRKYGCHLNAVITDLPEYMYSWKKSRGLKGWYAGRLSRTMLDLQGKSDSYVLFTEKMAARMGVEDKPYLVSEGFSDVHVYDGLPKADKHPTRTVVYAGNLSKLYGIRPLVDAFMQTEGDYELHLYGAGPDAAYIQACAETDTRIKFFGRVERREVLTALQRAHLIAINKPTADDYSNYSFSSKILECMTSGTPVLMTRVGGMPSEYYDYAYFWDDESVEGLARQLKTVLEKPLDELNQMGDRARAFGIREKDYLPQCKKISDFLEKTVR